MNRIQQLFLMQAQAAPNITLAAAQAISFTAADLLEVMKDSLIDFDPESEKVELCAGMNYEQDASVFGAERASGSLKIPIGDFNVVGGSPVSSYFGKALVALCGFVETAYSANNKVGFSYAPGPSTYGAVLKYFTGPTANDISSISHLFYNLLGNFEIDISANKYMILTIPIVGGAFGGESLATQPTVTKMRAKHPSLKGTNIIDIFDGHYQLLTAKISGNQPGLGRLNPNEINGMGSSEITDRKISVSLKFYADHVLDDIDTHPIAIARGETEGAFSLTLGGSGAVQIVVSSSRLQFNKPKTSEEGGIITFDVEGQLNANDLTILGTRTAHIISFDNQGATTPESPTSKTVIYPATTVGTLPTPPTKTSYTFGGWFTQTGGQGTQFLANTTVSASITVYAKWTPV